MQVSLGARYGWSCRGEAGRTARDGTRCGSKTMFKLRCTRSSLAFLMTSVGNLLNIASNAHRLPPTLPIMATSSISSTSTLPFGTDSAYRDAFLPQPTTVDFSKTDCYQLSLFKGPSSLIRISTCHSHFQQTLITLYQMIDMLKQFRKLDDAVTVRLNRANAQSRDDARRHGNQINLEEGPSCLNFWNQVGEITLSSFSA